MSSVTFEQINRWRVITLQKPETLNALDLPTVLKIRLFLKETSDNPNIVC